MKTSSTRVKVTVKVRVHRGGIEGVREVKDLLFSSISQKSVSKTV